MSYALDVKKELTTISVTKKCCQLAEIAGFLRFSSSIVPYGNGRMGMRISTDNPAVARLVLSLIKEYFGTKGSLSIDNDTMPLSRGRSYELLIPPEMNAEGILRETSSMPYSPCRGEVTGATVSRWFSTAAAREQTQEAMP